MCQQPTSTATAAATHLGTTVLSLTPSAQGSRRRRVWELDSHAHCPVVGVCLPIGTLKRLLLKASGRVDFADEYELHCIVVTESKRRTRLAELVQRELDLRFAQTLRRAAALKTTEALAEWWEQAREGAELPAALWAVLTHA